MYTENFLEQEDGSILQLRLESVLIPPEMQGLP